MMSLYVDAFACRSLRDYMQLQKKPQNVSNMKWAIKVTTSDSAEYQWLTYDLVLNTLEGYLGNQSLQYPTVTLASLPLCTQLFFLLKKNYVVSYATLHLIWHAPNSFNYTLGCRSPQRLNDVERNCRRLKRGFQLSDDVHFLQKSKSWNNTPN